MQYLNQALLDSVLRKIFSVTINAPNAQVLWRRIRGNDPDGFPLAAAS